MTVVEKLLEAQWPLSSPLMVHYGTAHCGAAHYGAYVRRAFVAHYGAAHYGAYVRDFCEVRSADSFEDDIPIHLHFEGV